MSENDNLTAHVYKPAGFCPACGYPCDPGICSECGRNVKRPLRRDPRVGRGRMMRIGRAVGMASVFLGAIGYGALAWAYRYAPSDVVSSVADAEGWWFQGIGSDIISWRWAEYDRRSLAHEKRIRTEIAAGPNHDWAGEYLAIGPFGGGLIVVAPRAGLAEYWFSGCGFGKRIGPDVRGILINETRTELCFEETLNEWESDTASRIRLEHFRWGARHCLIDAESRGDPDGSRTPIYYLRDYLYFRTSDLKLPLVGLPELPASRMRDFDLNWNSTTITSVRVTTGTADEEGNREFVVSCSIDRPVPTDAEPVGLFAEMPSAKVIAASDGRLKIEYTVSLSVGQSLIEPQVGWQFAFDSDDADEADEADERNASYETESMPTEPAALPTAP